ncbi:MAG: HAD family phosphatase [Bryobacterales bacterium]|nr:HAD family phosphatase [Bryobacterales bacterium]
MSPKLAFFDLDGTLVSSNVVHQYNWFARNSGDSMRRLRLLCALPRLGWLEMRSRRRFNEAFFQHYRGLRRDWLIESAPRMFEELLRPALYLGAPKLVEQNHREGYYTVLLTGSLDFAIEPLAAFLKFDRVVSNRLVFADGVATGDLEPPVLAEAEKAKTMRAILAEFNANPKHCRAYTDSTSDLPMLEIAGNPTAVNPSRGLLRIARERNWNVLDLDKPYEIS